MKVEVIIEVQLPDKREAITIYNSLRPDNRDFPSGMEFRESVSNDRIVYVVSASSPTDLKRLRNTIDDLLGNMETALNVIGNIEG